MFYQKSISVWPNAKQCDLLFPFTLPTVALPPRVTSTPVRFNRVYSEVTQVGLSVVFSPFLFPECINCSIRLMEQRDHTSTTHRFSFRITPVLWRCFHLKIEISALDYLAANTVGLFISSRPWQHGRHTVPLFALSSPVERGMGDGSDGSHIWTKQGLNAKPGVRRDMSQFIWLIVMLTEGIQQKPLWSVCELRYCTV